MGKAIDVSRTIEIEMSYLKAAGLLMASIGMAALGAGMAFGFIGGPDGGAALVLGLAGMIVFGVISVLIIWRLFGTPGPVITISPQGIRDIRIAPEFIPWNAVRNISALRFKHREMMVISVEPVVLGSLTLTRMARWSLASNRSLGVGPDGLCIPAGGGLDIDYDTLLMTCSIYWQAARLGQPSPPIPSAPAPHTPRRASRDR